MTDAVSSSDSPGLKDGIGSDIGSTAQWWDTPFMGGVLRSVMMILVSELGDKTFFIAAVLSMRHPRAVVFAAATLALALMTVLSTAMGLTMPKILPKIYTKLASMILFFVFGARLVNEALRMEGGVSEELKEVEEELARFSEDEELVDMEMATLVDDIAAKKPRRTRKNDKFRIDDAAAKKPRRPRRSDGV
eukprot:360411_1